MLSVIWRLELSIDVYNSWAAFVQTWSSAIVFADDNISPASSEDEELLLQAYYISVLILSSYVAI